MEREGAYGVCNYKECGNREVISSIMVYVLYTMHSNMIV